MLAKILMGIGVIVGGILIYAAFIPSTYLVSREATIAASPEKIFAYINSAKKAGEWMPWSEVDPKVAMTYFGPEEGIGSGASWTSDGQMGIGKSTIVKSIPNQQVDTEIVYKKPFEGSQLATISIANAGQASVVKWSVTGENNYVGRLFCMFANMDKIVGDMFEKGLATLKSKVEMK